MKTPLGLFAPEIADASASAYVAGHGFGSTSLDELLAEASALAVDEDVDEAAAVVVLDAVVDADAVLEVWDDAVAVERVASSFSVLGCLAAHPMTNSPNARV